MRYGIAIFAALWLAVLVLALVGVIPAPGDTGACATEYTAEGC